MAAASLLAVATAHASPNLLSNGGFESSNVNTATLNANNGYQAFNAGSTDVTDWTIGLNSIDIVDSASGHSWTYGVHSGNYAVDLNGTPGPGSIMQSFNTSTAGIMVSFWALSNEAGQTVNVLVNGNLVAALPTGTPPPTGINGAYNQYSFFYGGASTVGSNTIEFTIGPGSYGNTFLDDITVTSVPGPGSMAAFAVGALANLRRKRRKA